MKRSGSEIGVGIVSSGVWAIAGMGIVETQAVVAGVVFFDLVGRVEMETTLATAGVLVGVDDSELGGVSGRAMT